MRGAGKPDPAQAGCQATKIGGSSLGGQDVNH